MFRFLIVDDNDNDALLISSLIEQEFSREAKCEHCTTRWSTLAWLDPERHAPFDAILLDLNLPDSKGLETFRVVRAAAPDAAIVVWSGREDERGLRDLLIEEGASGYLDKGQVNPRQIFETLRDAATLHRSSVRMSSEERQIIEESERRARDYVEAVRKDESRGAHEEEQAMVMAAQIRQASTIHRLFAQQGETLGKLLTVVKSLQKRADDHDNKIAEVEETGRHTVVEVDKTQEETKRLDRRIKAIIAAVALGSFGLGEAREPIMKAIIQIFGG